MYAVGQGVPKDGAEAEKWFRFAADQGYAPAQYNLGVMYANGWGVPQNYDEAAKWHALAANQGYVIARYNLGVAYREGNGVPQNYSEAMKWFRLAADQGFAGAQYSLGLMYANGQPAGLCPGTHVVELVGGAGRPGSGEKSRLDLTEHDSRADRRRAHAGARFRRTDGDAYTTNMIESARVLPKQRPLPPDCKEREAEARNETVKSLLRADSKQVSCFNRHLDKSSADLGN
jgi:TPR repeat protein